MTKKNEAKQVPQLTPEMMEAFQAFMLQWNQTPTVEEKPKSKSKVSKPEKITKKYLREKYKDTTITVSNVTNGSVTYTSKKGGFPYIWSGYGDTDELTIDDLLIMPPKYLTTPWLIIMDDDGDIIEGLGLTEIYKHISILDEIDDIDNMTVESLEKACEIFATTQNRDFVHQAGSRIQELITNGELVDYRKIQQFGKILEKDFITIKEV